MFYSLLVRILSVLLLSAANVIRRCEVVDGGRRSPDSDGFWPWIPLANGQPDVQAYLHWASAGGYIVWFRDRRGSMVGRVWLDRGQGLDPVGRFTSRDHAEIVASAAYDLLEETRSIPSAWMVWGGYRALEVRPAEVRSPGVAGRKLGALSGLSESAA